MQKIREEWHAPTRSETGPCENSALIKESAKSQAENAAEDVTDRILKESVQDFKGSGFPERFEIKWERIMIGSPSVIRTETDDDDDDCDFTAWAEYQPRYIGGDMNINDTEGFLVTQAAEKKNFDFDWNLLIQF